MIRLRMLAAASVLLLWAAPAFGQTPPDSGGGTTTVPKTKPQQAKQGSEIKHGVYAEFDFGILAFIGGDAGKNNNAGVMSGFAFGADITPYAKIEARMLNATNDSNGKLLPSSITGDPASNPIVAQYPCPNVANTACAPVPDAQTSLVTVGVKAVLPMNNRLQLHAMGDIGVMLGNPAPTQLFKFNADKQLQDPNGVASGSTSVFGIGGGMEYYTHLRHFSVGADATLWIAGGGGSMFTLFPTIKYTF